MKQQTSSLEWSQDLPGFWRFETSGVLAPVVMRYLEGGPMTDEEVAIMARYLVQWMAAPVWKLDNSDLIESARQIRTRADINRWLYRALDYGIDPL